MTPKSSIEEWPAADLEAVPHCPVCGSTDRSQLYEGLTDRVFGVAPGRWSLQGCSVCGSAYLDPRPTLRSIGRAYAAYFTHGIEDHPIVHRKGGVHSMLHAWINGYQNANYGTRREPASVAGRWLLPLFPSLRAAADAECRHLRRSVVGGNHLLDVGCGNGGFLVLAQQAGWVVRGVDFDPDAVRTARARGLDVDHGGLELFDAQRECFDVITICHVIEHMFDPVAAIARIYDLLKPGGVLWLDTPNLDSLGHHRFGKNWHALDPPRHLVLFGVRSLSDLLIKAGFKSITWLWRGMTVFDVYAPSEAIAKGMIGASASYQGKPPLSAIRAELREMLQPKRREFLTLMVRK
ncbi:MAG TPA: class I SAM-dependent methyltransferase [Candidatus Saccharimonadales bacterium]|nr:class I SAM-dependent methyltransferase [Candidatus Saccharimonadales bacterium]